MNEEKGSIFTVTARGDWGAFGGRVGIAFLYSSV